MSEGGARRSTGTEAGGVKEASNGANTLTGRPKFELSNDLEATPQYRQRQSAVT